jgi:hypothetical protein
MREREMGEQLVTTVYNSPHWDDPFQLSKFAFIRRFEEKSY